MAARSSAEGAKNISPPVTSAMSCRKAESTCLPRPMVYMTIALLPAVLASVTAAAMAAGQAPGLLGQLGHCG